MEIDKIYLGDALAVLKTFPDDFIDCVITSPPYWGLRDYGVEGQLGIEKAFDEYISKLCGIFDEVKRVLKPEGTCWVNLGDTFSGSMQGIGGSGELSKMQSSNRGSFFRMNNGEKHGVETDLLDKCLCNIPFRFAIEMCNRGWIQRNTIIWHKPNCMPSSADDRFTVDFEYLFFFAKQKKYYFEQQLELVKEISLKRREYSHTSHKDSPYKKQCDGDNMYKFVNPSGRNKRCVWQITTQSFSEAHFATYPEELCVIPIKAGCPQFVCKKCGKAREKILEHTEEYSKFLGKGWHDHKDDAGMGMRQVKKESVNGIKRYDEKGHTDCGCNAGFDGGIVLDPFMGSGTTGLVAKGLGRHYIGIELNSKYIEMANRRIGQWLL